MLREILLVCTDRGDFKKFMKQKNNVRVTKLVKKAYLMAKETPARLRPGYEPFVPLPSSCYPIFDCYPKPVVDDHLQV